MPAELPFHHTTPQRYEPIPTCHRPKRLSRRSRPPTQPWSTIIGVLLLAGPGLAGTGEPTRRLECMACHAGPNRLVFDASTGQSRSVTISIDDFRGADHGKVHCLDCHTQGFATFPHRAKKTETCMDCHPRKEKGADADKAYDFDRMRKEFEGTTHFTEYIHAKERCCGITTNKPPPLTPAVVAGGGKPNREQNTGQRFTCEHCHEPHYFKATRRIREPLLIRANDNGPCLRCHRDGATGPLADPAKPSLLAAHRYLPHAQIHLDRTRCVDCHTNVMATVAHDLPEGRKADQGCNTCHSIDSVLLTRLYRYASDSGSGLGFHNSRMLQDGYVMGGNRHKWTDVAAYLLMSLSLTLVLVHGGWRALARWRSSFTPKGEADRSAS